jgi:NAD(P)-dependent dehydrogenase (short-subunit alcohol dehydrogenase family)
VHRVVLANRLPYDVRKRKRILSSRRKRRNLIRNYPEQSILRQKRVRPRTTLDRQHVAISILVEKAGGKCLPCVVDVRDEAQVAKAFEQAAEKFGGIDVLINNASAISLTDTPSTPMKRYDLMHSINARGTFLW